MPRFRVIVTGSGMAIPEDGWTGFATTRFVRAKSASAAADLALSLVAQSVETEPAFADSPAPTLGIDLIARVRSPLKLSRPNSGYTFVGPDAELEDALRIERQVGAGWFL